VGEKAGMEIIQVESREGISPQTKGKVCSRGEKREKHEALCFEGASTLGMTNAPSRRERERRTSAL
jgi:hypothetical protein